MAMLLGVGGAGVGRVLPAFRSLAGYRLRSVPSDLVAGLTLAAIAIPEQMATARLAGLSPQIGFIAFMAGSLAFAAFGDSRCLSSGSDSTITPIFAGGLAVVAAAGSPAYAAQAAALGILVGVVLVAGGVFRLGWIADLLSVPVTTGFLAGVAAHIVVSQLPGLLGLPPPDGSAISRAATLFSHLRDTNPFTVLIGTGTLAIVVVGERLSGRIPGALIGLGLATGAVAAFGLEGRGVTVLGSLPAYWPSPSIPSLSFAELRHLLPLGLIIALVVMVQTAATTRSFQPDPSLAPDVDQDYVGIGAGNILAGFFGAFPVNASPPRTAIVSESGGRSQLAGLIAAAIVLCVMTFGASLLSRIPHAALAGVLLFVAFRIVRTKQIAAIFRQTLGEFLLIVATIAAIVLLPIEQGVASGIALSLLHGIWSTTRAQVLRFERVPGTTIWWPPNPDRQGETLPGIVVVGFQAPLSFLNAYGFRREVLALLSDRPEPVRLAVLEASAILDIDYTAGQVLRQLIGQCHAKGIGFSIARLASVRARRAVTRFGIEDLLGPDRVFHSVEEAIRSSTGDAPKPLPGVAPGSAAQGDR